MATLVITFADAEEGGVDITPAGDLPDEDQVEYTEAQELVGMIMSNLHAQRTAQDEDSENAEGLH